MQEATVMDIHEYVKLDETTQTVEEYKSRIQHFEPTSAARM